MGRHTRGMDLLKDLPDGVSTSGPRAGKGPPPGWRPPGAGGDPNDFHLEEEDLRNLREAYKGRRKEAFARAVNRLHSEGSAQYYRETKKLDERGVWVSLEIRKEVEKMGFNRDDEKWVLEALGTRKQPFFMGTRAMSVVRLELSVEGADWEANWHKTTYHPGIFDGALQTVSLSRIPKFAHTDVPDVDDPWGPID